MYTPHNTVEKIKRRINGLCDTCLNMYMYSKAKSNSNKN